MTIEPPRFILASASPARLATLRAAGIEPTVHVSGVDESSVTAADTELLTLALARLKGEAVLGEVGTDRDAVIVACDSLLDVDGAPQGKPGDDDTARARWIALRGRSANLVTGHHVMVVRAGRVRRVSLASRTTVTFAQVTDAEIDAYVATGEPQTVAGAFTLDGFGGAFIEGVSGDPHGVIGISLPLLRVALADLGVRWVDLWAGDTTPSNR